MKFFILEEYSTFQEKNDIAYDNLPKHTCPSFSELVNFLKNRKTLTIWKD